MAITPSNTDVILDIENQVRCSTINKNVNIKFIADNAFLE